MGSRFEEDVEMHTPASHENSSPDEGLKDKTPVPAVVDEMQTPDYCENVSPVNGLKEKTPTPNVVDEMQTSKAHEKQLTDIKIGMEFETEQQAYDFYREYARKWGFGIRKSWFYRNRKRQVSRRRFCCSREGYRREDKRDVNVKNHRPESRTGCLAHINIALQSNGKYVITDIDDTHNHHITPKNSHMCRSQRQVSVAQAIEVDLEDSGGLRPKTMIDLRSAEAGGAENVGFLQIDDRNYLQSKRMSLMEKGDAGYVLQYLQGMIASDPGSFYAVQLDEDEKISGIFWADSQMVNDYYSFGDVVCFDTTYRTNNYSRPFAPFVGVNHHRQTVIFGAALMYDETTEAFQWVFKAFLEAMSEKEPKTILTDQDKAMAKAISIALPNTYHHICIWHIYQNAAKCLSSDFNQHKSFKSDFNKCIFEFEEEGGFLEAWDMMLEKYGLRENCWLQQIFNEREKWALVYGRNIFCADMRSKQWSEGMNGVLRNYLPRSHSIQEFFRQFERLVNDTRVAEVEADLKMTETTPVLVFKVPILFSARNVYTPEIFKLFQEEWVNGMNCIPTIHSTVDTIITYHVHSMMTKRDYVVIFESLQKIVECGCKKFEFGGILCGHALRVLDHAGLVEVPDRYILKRWRKDAKISGVNMSSPTSDGKKGVSTRYKELIRTGIKLFTKAADTQEAFVLTMEVIKDVMKKLENLDNNRTFNSASQSIPPDGMSVEPTQMKGFKRKEKGSKGRPRKKSSFEMNTNRSSSNAQDPTPSVSRAYQMNPYMNQQDEGHNLITFQLSQASSVFEARPLMVDNEEGAKLPGRSNIPMERPPVGGIAAASFTEASSNWAGF